jgi:exonuclease 1
MNRVKMLLHFGVKPYMVFDGDFLPSKAKTEAARAESRERHRKQGLEFLKAGKASLAAAEFQKAIDITPEMARGLIEELKKIGVPFVVAPYEADAQLVYLERKGLIDGILSEDSDLLVFGCKVLLTKLDKFGNCVEVNRRDFCAVREVSLTGWTDADFRRMAILSGCDYLAGIKGTGLKTAHRYLRKYKTPEKVVQRLRFESKAAISEDYLPQFYQAELTFLHQRVFCPEKKQLVLLTDDPTNKAQDLPFIGADIEPQLARAIAAGDVNPITRQPILLRVPAVQPKASPKRPRAPSTAGSGSPNSPNSPNDPRTASRRPVPAGNKPISSYFKKNGRIPMGEMDRNCFPVDSQAVAALTHNGLVPRVFPLPRPYLPGARMPEAGGLPRATTTAVTPRLRRRTEPISAALDSIRVDDDARQRGSVGPGLSPSVTRPTKKARLCDVTIEREVTDRLGDTTEVQRSKFFPGPASTAISRADSKESDKKEGYLFSDDSIQEALLLLPDIDGFQSPPKTRRSIAIFEDNGGESCNSQSQGDSQTSADRQSFVTSDTQTSADIADFQDSDIMPPPPEKASSVRVSLDKFFYHSEDTTDGSTGSETPASVASTAPSRSSMLFTPSLLGSAAGETPATANSLLTPLESIGARAFRRRSMGSPLRQNHERPRRVPSNRGLSSMPINPAFVPLPRVDVAELEALTTTGGSEDQLPFIDHDTENDRATENESDIKGSGLVRLDLSRFLHH